MKSEITSAVENCVNRTDSFNPFGLLPRFERNQGKEYYRCGHGIDDKNTRENFKLQTPMPDDPCSNSTMNFVKPNRLAMNQKPAGQPKNQGAKNQSAPDRPFQRSRINLIQNPAGCTWHKNMNGKTAGQKQRFVFESACAGGPRQLFYFLL